MAIKLVDQCHMNFLRLNLKAAKAALAEANRSCSGMQKSAAMSQLNRARSYLRQAMDDVEIALYGVPRRYLHKVPTLQAA